MIPLTTGGTRPRPSFERLFFTAILLLPGVFSVGASANGFLENHWPDSIPPQGKPPADWTQLEKSLQPESCGKCHLKQYEEWQTSLHSRAMGPGVAGQLIGMVNRNPAEARLCWSCHAPLAEQQALLQDKNGRFLPNSSFDPQLQSHGVTCASCHVRERNYFGPPRRGEPDTTGKLIADGPHDGFTAVTEFTQSGFCKGCHQFEQSDYRINGKLIENTWQEWRQSNWAEQGVQCQDCHMPDRRHVWRGIHDKEMTRSAFTLNTSLEESNPDVDATIEITNSGAGHNFPTYMTPKVFVMGRLLDEAGEVIAGSDQSYAIGWESYDLRTEVYDTRLAPGEKKAIAYQYERGNATELVVEVVVYPDHWYRRFFANWLETDNNPESRALIQQAWEHASNSNFVAYRETISLD